MDTFYFRFENTVGTGLFLKKLSEIADYMEIKNFKLVVGNIFGKVMVFNSPNDLREFSFSYMESTTIN